MNCCTPNENIIIIIMYIVPSQGQTSYSLIFPPHRNAPPQLVGANMVRPLTINHQTKRANNVRPYKCEAIIYGSFTIEIPQALDEPCDSWYISTRRK